MKSKTITESFVITTTDIAELRRRYDKILENAHSNLQWEYLAHESAARKLWRHFPEKDVCILCYGNDNESTQKALADKGFTVIDKLPPHELPAMGSSTYDAIISVGTFVKREASPNDLAELARITKPEGMILLSLRYGEHRNPLIDQEMERLANAGIWKVVEVFGEHYLKDGENLCKLYILQSQ
ncbi:class I SAM-dependent methyltransferase [Pseudodesulfovibrio sp. zrk46]|uniref:class I SAM-dependent methyltransferase n=1 Tax=Pseudodesulfovibrio sp. zrk46 TaxID=2725288 RepID=UPI001449D827|nr:class I SAM-dependent methyltransferase [Pseudodesulfovibrio sp. zrk46]QJB56636.1 class I SAM-dependent methyltransferase [Pseudodesulfovibrio sp. zrk46]